LLAICHNRNCADENRLITPVVQIFLLEGCSSPTLNFKKSLTTPTLVFFHGGWGEIKKKNFLCIILISLPDSSWDPGKENKKIT